MDTVVALRLERPAKKSGGDRYQAINDQVPEVFKGFQIYLPQAVTRKNGVPMPVIAITIHTAAEEV